MSTSPDVSLVQAAVGQPIDGEKSHVLTALGERVRSIRGRRAMTRKALAVAAQVSERHLANLEYGEGNASILVLQQVADALQCSLAELLGDVTTSSPEWLMLRDLLAGKDEAAIRQVRFAANAIFGQSNDGSIVSARIALIGLRGAGKSTLGRLLATALGFPFIEISREIEALANCPLGEIQALYGINAYRRYERRAIADVLEKHSECVIATPGGLVSDTTSFNEILTNCTVVWLQAKPEDHMGRVAAQGDLRPMAASAEAMEDLKAILAGRAAFYSKAHIQIDTSAQSQTDTLMLLCDKVRARLSMQ